MPVYEETLDHMVTELLEKAKAELSQTSPGVRRAKQTLAAASQCIADSASLDTHTKAAIDECPNKKTNATAEYCDVL